MHAPIVKRNNERKKIVKKILLWADTNRTMDQSATAIRLPAGVRCPPYMQILVPMILSTWISQADLGAMTSAAELR